VLYHHEVTFTAMATERLLIAGQHEAHLFHVHTRDPRVISQRPDLFHHGDHQLRHHQSEVLQPEAHQSEVLQPEAHQSEVRRSEAHQAEVRQQEAWPGLLHHVQDHHHPVHAEEDEKEIIVNIK
jgi:hypothetical protein